MSGGPPSHHSHGIPSWNHLQVPNYFPGRQPQHAHMSNEHPFPTWHTPTTEPVKPPLHSHLFNLDQMLNQRHSPGVDLSTRNGQAPISLSVRDAKQINSLPMGALDGGPPTIPPSVQQQQLQLLQQQQLQSLQQSQGLSPKKTPPPPAALALPPSVIVSATANSSSHDENSNGSLTATTIEDEDSADSGGKSRRKRKPLKTVRVNRDDGESGGGAAIAAMPPTLPTAGAAKDAVEAALATMTGAAEEIGGLSGGATGPTASSGLAGEKSEVPGDVAAVPAAAAAVAPDETKAELPTMQGAASTPAPETKSHEAAHQSQQQQQQKPQQQQQQETPMVIDDDDEEEEEDEDDEEDAAVKESIESIEAEVKASSKTTAEKTKIAEQSTLARDVTSAVSKEDVDEVVEALKSPEPVANTVDSSETATATGSNLQKAKDSSPNDSQTSFVAVEDELEKMFAGIGDTKLPEMEAASTSNSNQQQQQQDQALNDGVTSTSNDVTASENGNKTSHKRGRPKGSKNQQSNSRRSSQEITPKKKHKMSKKKTPIGGSGIAAPIALLDESPKPFLKRKKKSNLDGVKDVYAYDSGSNTSSTKSKGPFVQIRGPRDSPISVSVINGPVVDDEHADSRKVLKSKKFHDDSEYRHKVRTKGLHCSTLSNKYDAQTKDVTWICVFCKRGPHAAEPITGIVGTPQYSPGDLFGPYVITTECPEYQRRLSDPFDLQFKSKKALSSAAASSAAGTAKKAKRKIHQLPQHQFEDPTMGTADQYLEGMVDQGTGTYEVWVHEDCIVWSPGVYLVGAKIVGLEGAVWGACSVQCQRCQHRGAAVSCLKRGCNTNMHVGCAKLAGWLLDEDTYKTYCAQHRPQAALL